jgi:hypothetical protein
MVTAKSAADADPTRRAHVANVLSLIDFIAADRLVDPTRISLSDTMDNLLSRIEWELVDVEAIKWAVVMLLVNSPASEAADVSEEAVDEHATLKEIIAGIVDEEQLTDIERASREKKWAEHRAAVRAETQACEEEIRTLGFPARFRSPNAGKPGRGLRDQMANLVCLALVLYRAGELEALITEARSRVLTSPAPTLQGKRAIARIEQETRPAMDALFSSDFLGACDALGGAR